jgi:hypothetical protein
MGYRRFFVRQRGWVIAIGAVAVTGVAVGREVTFGGPGGYRRGDRGDGS